VSDPSRYTVPAGRHRVAQSIERSRFICTLERVESPEQAQEVVRAMNAEFADATHNCWAYVIGPPGSTSRVGMSDAGEPHGTAGRPMLTVLLHSGLGDIAAVVTRYYGGVKLGTGGLVKAYSTSVQLALESVPTTERVDYATLTVTIAYPHVTATQQLLPDYEAEILDQRFGVDVCFELRLPAPSEPAFRQALADATRGSAVVTVRT
jgi:uncharacterized YigZ family protein